LSKGLKKILKTTLPIVLGIFLVWYWYTSTAPADRELILFYIKDADPFWVGISIVLGLIAYLARAIRWNYMLKPMGYKPKLSNNVLIILMSYFANLGIPRMGEILRPTALATYEGVPFEKGLGTIITERVVDVLMLLFIISITLVVQTDIILSFLEGKGFPFGGILVALGTALLGLIFFVIFIKKSQNSIATKIKHLVQGLFTGLLSVFKMENKWGFVFQTLVIWSCYIGMFWAIKFTVLETIDLSLTQLLVAFVFGALAMMFTNGGIGLYPIAVSQALAIYGISKVSGDAFGWIMWIAQTSVLVVFGAISFLLLPLLNRNR
jgi:uncharacterized protein (TIRG00374 family)